MWLAEVPFIILSERFGPGEAQSEADPGIVASLDVLGHCDFHHGIAARIEGHGEADDGEGVGETFAGGEKVVVHRLAFGAGIIEEADDVMRGIGRTD